MKQTKEKLDEGQFRSLNDLDLSTIPGSVTQIFTANLDKFNQCRTYEDVVALCHQLLDDAGLNTGWTRKFFFSLKQIKDNYPNPRKAYEQAMIFMNNARMRGMGLGMDRGGSRRRFYEDDGEISESIDNKEKEDFKKKLRKGKVVFKYTNKDGNEHKAVGTMNPDLMDIPDKKTQSDVDEAEKKKTSKLPEDTVFYYDLEAKGFCSFKMGNFIGYV